MCAAVSHVHQITLSVHKTFITLNIYREMKYDKVWYSYFFIEAPWH
jgi:hypothetical protein